MLHMVANPENVLFTKTDTMPVGLDIAYLINWKSESWISDVGKYILSY